jgi:hypothetical protein
VHTRLRHMLVAHLREYLIVGIGLLSFHLTILAGFTHDTDILLSLSTRIMHFCAVLLFGLSSGPQPFLFCVRSVVPTPSCILVRILI